jgi:hypothetical protein
MNWTRWKKRVREIRSNDEIRRLLATGIVASCTEDTIQDLIVDFTFPLQAGRKGEALEKVNRLTAEEVHELDLLREAIMDLVGPHRQTSS